MKRIFSSLFFIFFTNTLFALSVNNFHLNGYLDASYQYLARSNQFISGVANRDNDLAENGFTLHQLAMTASITPSHGFGALVNLVIGRDGFGLSPQGLDPDVFHSQQLGVGLPKAYLLYNFDQAVIEAGLLLTISGYESYDYTEDKQFSRSIIDGYAQPGSHMGIRYLKHVSNALELIAGLGNGWDRVRQASRLNAIELGVKYQATPSFYIMLDTLSSKEYLTDNAINGPMGFRQFLDLITSYALSNETRIAVNANLASQSKALLANNTVGHATWEGIAIYLNHQLNEKAYTSLRAETFYDENGYRTGVRQNWREATLTFGYYLQNPLLIQAETRADISNQHAFLAKNKTQTNKTQLSFAINLLYTV